MNAITHSLKSLLALCALAAACLHSGGFAVAGDLVFSFTNPTFGGNPGNAATLLNNANAQNSTQAPATAQVGTLDRFTQSLQSAMLSKLQSQVTGVVFDSKGALVSGTQYTAGDYQVTIIVNPDKTVSLSTLEISTGSSTVINVGNIVSQP
jgi:curli production assembly/transport component CsgF